jgi:hypothetical protein
VVLHCPENKVAWNRRLVKAFFIRNTMSTDILHLQTSLRKVGSKSIGEEGCNAMEDIDFVPGKGFSVQNLLDQQMLSSQELLVFHQHPRIFHARLVASSR